MGRRAVGLVALLLWGLLAFLTVFVLIDSGPTILVLISLLVVGLLGVALFGSLGE